MSAHQVHVFISHSWKYSSVYETLASWIFQESWNSNNVPINFRNYSVPKDDPIHNAPNDRALKIAIHNQIARSHVIVIPTGLYTTHSKWIQKEIDGAKEYGKPILAVNPRGQIRTAEIVVSNSNGHVGWTKNSVVQGVWNLYWEHYK